MKRRMMMFAAVLLAALLLVPMAAMAKTKYVKTATGSNVNVRAEPSTDAEKWNPVSYGTRVNVLETENGWSLCEIPGFSNPGWICSKYLTSTYPGENPRNRERREEREDYMGEDLNTISYRSFYAVNHYDVYVNHQTSTFLNLRWAPSESAAIIRRCYNGTELTVYAESNGWYQVYDPESGFVGFMRPKYLEAF